MMTAKRCQNSDGVKIQIVARCIVMWTYNVWFHPLAKFPGPLLGRCSLVSDWFQIALELET